MKPRLLDLFRCAGGAAKGYQRAGFEVYGVDIVHQPRYAGDWFRAVGAVEAMNYLVGCEAIGFWSYERMTYQARHLAEFDAIHASPPCQAHSDLQKQSKIEYEDFIEPAREFAQASGLPYIIENVEGAPLLDPVTLCGAMFPELRVYRHRLFESNVPLVVPEHPKHVAKCFTHDKRKAHYGAPVTDETFFQVTGGGNATVAQKARAMGIDWMTGKELNEAIPPAYTEFLGRQLMVEVERRRVAA